MDHHLPLHGDMSTDELTRYGGQALDWVCGYLERPEAWPVLPDIQPGDLRAALPAAPPLDPEPFERILADFARIIPGATTHWNHPGFFGYFAITGSAPGVIGELLAAALNVNAMLWRTGPAATELEELTVDWLRQLLGLPEEFRGTINDTASTSTMHALATAREAALPGARELGLAGRSEVPRLVVYCSEEAHSSIDKAAVTLGLGLSGVRRVATDIGLRLDPGALEAAIARDRAAGVMPMAVVGTVGTTSTTAVDPIPEIASICEREGVWLHVDAAYGGAAGVVPELRERLAGVERADSVVVNPHKWLFVPVDCSVLLLRDPSRLVRAFSVLPEYLADPAAAGAARVSGESGESDSIDAVGGAEVRTGIAPIDLMDYGLALGRRFRALKLWFVLRYFGASGLADRIREHVRLARLFAGWVDASSEFERVAEVPFSVVVFRLEMAGGEDAGPGEPDAGEDAINARLLERVNASGEVFLSHTRVRGRFALRLAIGNLRTEEQHVLRAWELLNEGARELLREGATD